MMSDKFNNINEIYTTKLITIIYYTFKIKINSLENIPIF